MKFDNLKRNCIKSVTCQISICHFDYFMLNKYIFLDPIRFIKSTSNGIIFLHLLTLLKCHEFSKIDL